MRTIGKRVVPVLLLEMLLGLGGLIGLPGSMNGSAWADSFPDKEAWQQANEPDLYRAFRSRFVAAFNTTEPSANATEPPALARVFAPDFDRPERTVGFLGGIKADNGGIEAMRFRYFDKKMQRGETELLAVYHVEFEKGAWFEIRIGLSTEGLIRRLILTDPNYNEALPLVRSRTPLQLPFKSGEEWYVLWGGESEELNYHVSSRAQKNALDLLIVHPYSHQSFKTDGRANSDYYAFGKDILAPCGGVVVKVIDDVADNVPGVMNPKQLTGNTVVIRTPNDEYVLLAHLKAGSIRVAEGDEVEPGQPLAHCGNSGNSSEPHLHLQMTDRFEGGTGIQMTFAKVLLSDGATAANYAPIRTNRIARE